MTKPLAFPTAEQSEPKVGTTRERILYEAASLFAERGYVGTTTRQIADRVGIRQPSLFHHFESKAAIASSLLDVSLTRVLPTVRALSLASESASSKLYAYVYFDTRFLAMSPYNLVGIYFNQMLRMPEFERWRALSEDLHEVIRQVIREGQTEGEIIPVEPAFAQEIVTSFVQLTVRSRFNQSPAAASQFADDAATIALRALVSTQSKMPSVRAAGVALADREYQKPRPT